MSRDEPSLDRRHLFRTIAITGSDGEKNLRTIRPISQDEHDSYERPGIQLTGPTLKENESIVEEVEWFADDRRTIAGVVSRYRSDDDWGFVVARRDEHRVFHAVEVKVGIKDRDTARARLLETMADSVKHWAGRAEQMSFRAPRKGSRPSH